MGDVLRLDEQGPSGMEGDPLAFEFGSGMAEAEVTNGAHPARQDMAQVAEDKLDSGDSSSATATVRSSRRRGWEALRQQAPT